MPTGERNPAVHQPEPAGAGEGRLGTGWRRGPRIQSTERDRRGSTATGDAGSLAHGLFPFLFKTTGSRITRELAATLEASAARMRARQEAR